MPRPPARPRQVGKVSWGHVNRPYVPVTQEEREYVRELARLHPDWGTTGINRARFKKFPIDRSVSSMKAWIEA
jgi:hypothetical protein